MDSRIYMNVPARKCAFPYNPLQSLLVLPTLRQMPGAVQRIRIRPLVERLLTVEEHQLQAQRAVRRLLQRHQHAVQHLRHIDQHCARHRRIGGALKARSVREILAVIVAGEHQLPLGARIERRNDVLELEPAQIRCGVLEFVRFDVPAERLHRFDDVLLDGLVLRCANDARHNQMREGLAEACVVAEPHQFGELVLGDFEGGVSFLGREMERVAMEKKTIKTRRERPVLLPILLANHRLHSSTAQQRRRRPAVSVISSWSSTLLLLLLF